ncbi:MAG: fructosamine kinase family protein [Mariniblastus sp.]
MSSELFQAIEEIIEKETSQRSIIQSVRPTTGGCINDTAVATLNDGREFFVKSNHKAPELFGSESIGLKAIRKTNTIRVPEVVGTTITQSGVGILVLEKIDSTLPNSNFFENFGRKLAELHRVGVSEKFGFEANNHIGQTRQINSWDDDWIQFWSVNRIGFQLDLASRNGYATRDLTEGCEKVNRRLEQLIGRNEVPPSLIHGDLWSGNFMVSPDGQPVLVDPAVYFGARETEFGITTLFGGFDSRFYAAYNERWPMPEGWQDRVEIYKLYHLLNHLNLFGTRYLSSCFEIIKKFD